MEELELDERKTKILNAIIRNYLETGEPVGSRTLSKYTDLKPSSATIRNEMADLEDLGYIFQPHTSAGRIPSDKGYRFYVDLLMEKKEQEISEREDALLEKTDKVEKVLQQAAKVLASNTNYATMITGPQVGANKLKFLQLSRMEEGKLLAVIVVEGNLVKNTILNIESDISEEELLKLNVLINSALNGLTIDQINLGIITQLKEQAGDYSCVVGSVLEAVAEAIKHESAPVIYTSGANNIFRYPELSDEKNAQRLISTFEEKEELAKLLEKPDEDLEKLVPYFKKDPALDAMFHTTVVPTMLSGSAQANILPAKVTAVVNSRVLEGDTVESVKKHLEEIVPDEVEVRVLKGSDASPTSLYDGAMKDLLVEIGGKIYGDVIPCPEMMLGGTDARFVYDMSDRVYRFSTIYAREDHHVHAANEFTGVEELADSIDFYMELLTRYGETAK